MNDKDEKIYRYSIVFWDVAACFKLKPTESLLMALIYGFCKNKNGRCFATQKYMAERLNITETTINQTMNQLVNKGLIEKTFPENSQKLEYKTKAIWNDLAVEAERALNAKKRNYGSYPKNY